MNLAPAPQPNPPIIQTWYAAGQESPKPATEAMPPETMPATQAVPAGMSLDQAISVTLLADPKIRAGLEAIHQANGDLLTSSLPPNPTLQVMGQYLPLRPFTPTMPGGPSEIDVQVGYPIDWFLFGKRAAAMASGRLGVRQSEADYADLIRQRVTATATAFFDVLEAKSLLDLARQDTENLTRLEAATRRAVDAGGRPVVELNRVRLDLLKSQQDLREADSALAVAKAKLRAQFGRTDADPTFDVAGNLDAPLTAEPLPLEEAFALAQQNRPDIQSLRLQVSKAEADAVVEQRKAYPQITPMFGYTRQYETPLGAPDADSWVASVTAPLPLFDRNQGNRAKAQSVAAQNNDNLQAGVVALRAEIEETVRDFSTACQNARSVAQEQLRLAAWVRDSITRAYDLGGRPLIDVLDAERSYRDTYRLYISSRANYWRSVYKYNSAIGKQVAR
jgi:cobalt-zinc-cadmium efflux system outer membrane protein